MKRHLLSVLTLAVAITATAQDALFSSFSYEGHDARFETNTPLKGRFFNPILPGYYPDPSVCRGPAHATTSKAKRKKGKPHHTYYMVNSSFSFFPGVPIFESEDLVNWRQIGHVLNRKSQLPLAGQWVSGGIYAPTIRYNERNGYFYMITTNVGAGGNFFVKTRDPHQGWSDPIYLPKVTGIDPSFLFDRDGKAYIVHNAPVMGQQEYEGQTAIRLLRFDVEGDSTVGEPIEVVRGGAHVVERPIWIEGPHLYHIGKYYYLMCAEGGTEEGHSEVIFRARKPEGPWEECPYNPILTQRTGLDANRPDPVTCTGHADLIETAEGEWWAVFLGCRPYEEKLFNTGRDTYMLPVTWRDGWPVILEPGKPVPQLPNSPTNLLTPQLHTSPTQQLPNSTTPPQTPLTGNFSYTDRFDAPQLHHRWVFLRNPPARAYTLSADGLTLHPTQSSVRQTQPLSALFCRQQHTCFSVETVLTFAPTSGQQLAGLTLFQNEQYHFTFGKTLLNGRPALVLKRTEKSEMLIGSVYLPADNATIRLRVEGDGRRYSFFYAFDADTPWQPLAIGADGSNLSTLRAGGFIGAMIGLYATHGNTP